MIYVFLATGFEEVEALGPIDVCRRAGLKVKTVSVTDEQVVTGAHGIGIVADSMFAENDYSDAEMLFLPGGLPGATNLDAHEGLRRVVLAHSEAGKALAAICAAPLVYGNLGLADGKKMTCYPGFEKHFNRTVTYIEDKVAVSGNVITAKGPGAVFLFGREILKALLGEVVADKVLQGTFYSC